MMTRAEFIKRYHYYSTQSQITAITEALLVNTEGILGDLAVVVKFGKLGYGLMLQSAAEYLGMKSKPAMETETSEEESKRQ